MVDAIQVKNRIVDIIKTKGPSLPIQIAKAVNMNSLFISAFLSELVGDRRVKMSSLKVGGSPLYLLEEQEIELEKFYNYMHPKEAEAFLLLKKNKILKDSEQDPAIRVALRAIKDFAVSFKNDNEIYWRHLQVPESEVIQILSSEETIGIKEIKQTFVEVVNKTAKIDEKEKKVNKEEEKSKEILKEEEIEKPVKRIRKPREYKEKEELKKEEKEEFQNPLVLKQLEKPKKEKPKSEFVLKVIEFLKNNNFELIEEKEHKAKEYKLIVRIGSDLGPISFLTEAKDKKIISEDDLKKLLSESQSIPLSAFMIYTGELNKKAKEYLERYSSILKARKLE